jgi:hypothetical protein
MQRPAATGAVEVSVSLLRRGGYNAGRSSKAIERQGKDASLAQRSPSQHKGSSVDDRAAVRSSVGVLVQCHYPRAIRWRSFGARLHIDECAIRPGSAEWAQEKK